MIKCLKVKYVVFTTKILSATEVCGFYVLYLTTPLKNSCGIITFLIKPRYFLSMISSSPGSNFSKYNCIFFSLWLKW